MLFHTPAKIHNKYAKKKIEVIFRKKKLLSGNFADSHYLDKFRQPMLSKFSGH